jgi:hypothetical protein
MTCATASLIDRLIRLIALVLIAGGTALALYG